MHKKIVIAGDRVFLKFLDLDYFNERAKEAEARVYPLKSTDDRLFKESISEAEAVILIDRPLRSEHLEAAGKCRLILALEVGYDFIDVQAATEQGIMVCHVPAYCTEEVALHALTLTLAATRRLIDLIHETWRGGWDYKVSMPLYLLRGRRLGIVGLGRIGRALVPLAAGVGLEVSAYDPYLSDDLFALLGVRRHYELAELLGESDIVSLHVPLTPETHHMIGARELGLMKPEAVLVNTCRGRVVDEASLCEALKAATIAGAGLDVLEKEPPDADNPLLRMSNVMVTPHVAWYSEQSMQRLRSQGMDEVVGVLTGKRPRHIVNPEVLGRRRSSSRIRPEPAMKKT